MGGVPWALAFHLNPSEINPPAIRANKVRLWSQAAFRFPVPPGTTPFLLFILPFHLSVPLLLRIRPPHRAIFSGARTTRDTPLTLILLPSSPPNSRQNLRSSECPRFQQQQFPGFLYPGESPGNTGIHRFPSVGWKL